MAKKKNYSQKKFPKITARKKRKKKTATSVFDLNPPDNNNVGRQGRG